MLLEKYPNSLPILLELSKHINKVKIDEVVHAIHLQISDKPLQNAAIFEQVLLGEAITEAACRDGVTMIS